MNFLDIILAVPMCFFIYKGWKRGFIFELAALVGIVLGCWAAIHFSTWVASLLKIKGEGTVLIAFFITFAAVVAGSFFLGKAVEGIIKMVKANGLNKILGAVAGMLKIVCILAVLINYILIIDRHQAVITPKVQQESILFRPVHQVGNHLTARLHNYVEKVRSKN